MTEQLQQALKQHFGYDAFRPGQSEIIQPLLEGQDVLGILPTGSGKSLCYQLPTYLQGGLTVIVSPLISLMQDQVIQLNLRGEKRAVALNATVDRTSQQFILTHLKNYLFLFTSPETLNRPDVLKALKRNGVQLFVVDEAHCISQWGVDFRPSYLRLKWLKAQLEPRQTLMLTATATPRVQADILAKMALPKALKVIYSVDRPNIFLDVLQCADEHEKQQQLLALLQHIKLPGIIYFSSRQSAETMSVLIRQRLQLNVAFYHGALDTKDRYLIQQQFMAGQLQVICATNAFGMGINKADVRFVIHYHAPLSFESYLQEIGRAGRDGQQSIAILMTSADESYRQQHLLTMGLPDAAMIKAFFKRPTAFQDESQGAIALLQRFYENKFTATQTLQMLKAKQLEKSENLVQFNRFVESSTCRRQTLLQYFGEKSTVSHDDHCCQMGFEQDISRTLQRLALYQTAANQGNSSTTTVQEHASWPQVLNYLFE